MTTHSSILAWKNSMDKGAWRATVHGTAESNTTEHLPAAVAYIHLNLYSDICTQRNTKICKCLFSNTKHGSKEIVSLLKRKNSEIFLPCTHTHLQALWVGLCWYMCIWVCVPPLIFASGNKMGFKKLSFEHSNPFQKLIIWNHWLEVLNCQFV